MDKWYDNVTDVFFQNDKKLQGLTRKYCPKCFSKTIITYGF